MPLSGCILHVLGYIISSDSITLDIVHFIYDNNFIVNLPTIGSDEYIILSNVLYVILMIVKCLYANKWATQWYDKEMRSEISIL